MSAPSPAVTVVVADDHPIARRGLTALLEATPQITLLAACADADAALWAASRHHPDVLVLGLSQPGRLVLELIPDVRRDLPETQVVILSAQPHPGYARRALASGAYAYIPKHSAEDELIATIRAAAHAETRLCPRGGAALAGRPDGGPISALSPRQRTVLSLVALGHANAEIAARLALSLRTVEAHRSTVMRTIGAADRHDLVTFALDHGLIGPRRVPASVN